MAPALELFARVAPEKPANPTALPTPGTCSTYVEACWITASVRSRDAPYWQLHVDDQISLVLRRDEAGWHRGESL